MKRIPLLLSAAGLSAAAAAVILRRLRRNRAVEHAVRISSADAPTGVLLLPGAVDPDPPAGRPAGSPTTPVPPDAVSAVADMDSGTADSDAGATAEEDEARAAPGRPNRTWLVDNGSEWDGNPLEQVVLPDPGDGNGSGGRR